MAIYIYIHTYDTSSIRLNVKLRFCPSKCKDWTAVDETMIYILNLLFVSVSISEMSILLRGINGHLAKGLTISFFRFFAVLLLALLLFFFFSP